MIKYFIVIALYLISLSLINLAGQNLLSFINNQFLTIFSILLGLIIGTVSVLISSISSIYSFLLSYLNREKINPETMDRIVKLKTTINATIIEIKHNTLFIFFSFILNFLIVIFITIDIPYVAWPFEPSSISKANIFYSISLCSMLLSFYAIYDIILSIFTIHDCQNKLLGS
jgi:hypothetical protein